MVGGNYEGFVSILNVESGEVIHSFPAHSENVGAVVFHPDTNSIVTGGSDGLVAIWETESGKQIRQLDRHFMTVTSLAISSDGKRLIAAGIASGWDAPNRDVFSIRIYDFETGDHIRGFHEDTSIYSIALSSDDKYLIAGAGDYDTPGFVEIWYPNSGKLLSSLPQKKQVDVVAFSPSNNRFVTVDNELLGTGEATIWDTSSNKALSTLELHTATINALAFSPDGQYLLTASTDQTFAIWDVERGQELCVCKGHTGGVVGSQFVADMFFRWAPRIRSSSGASKDCLLPQRNRQNQISDMRVILKITLIPSL